MGSVGCFGQIENIKRQSLFYAHRQRRRNDLIDLGLDGLHLVVSRAFGKQIVALALLPLDVCIPAARASEHVHHRAIQDMLRRMGGLIFSLVVELSKFSCLLFASGTSLFLGDKES